jgi:putative endonuclease
MPMVNRVITPLFERLLGIIDHATARLDRCPPRPQHLALGIRGEEAAFFFLRKEGYVITARSWRSHRYPGDIDLIGWDDDCLCFIEVKTRTRRDIASAESAVNDHKRKTLRKMGRHYLRQLPPPARVRFDVLSIYFEVQRSPDFTLFRNAFDWSENAAY